MAEQGRYVVRDGGTEQLAVELSESEEIQFLKDQHIACEAVTRERGLEEQMKSALTAQKKSVEAHVAHRNTLTRILTAGEEMRGVKYEEVFDWTTQSVYRRRLDTGEFYWRRDMSHAEAKPQGDLYAEQDDSLDTDETATLIRGFLSSHPEARPIPPAPEDDDEPAN